MDSVEVAGDSVTSVTSAILDSGTSLLVGPSEDVKKIASKVVRTHVCLRLVRVCVVVSMCLVNVCVFVGGHTLPRYAVPGDH